MVGLPFLVPMRVGFFIMARDSLSVVERERQSYKEFKYSILENSNALDTISISI